MMGSPNITINFPEATIGKCASYMKVVNAEIPGPEITIVISPLRCAVFPEMSAKMSYGCNMWKSCKNEGCSYCQMGMGGLNE